MPWYPPRLFDVRSALKEGDATGAMWLVTSTLIRWAQWLTAEELAQLRAVDCPEWALTGTCDNPSTPTSE